MHTNLQPTDPAGTDSAGRPLRCSTRHLPRGLALLIAGLPVGLVIGFAGEARAQTEWRGEIREGTLFRIPIEVRQWTYEGVARRVMTGGEAPEDVLVQDLSFSGFFEIRREAGLAWGASGGGSTRPVEAIAEGVVQLRRGKPELTGSLIDAAKGNLIFRRGYELGDPPDRWAVHAFADDIVLYLTGERGVASTRVAFVGTATGHKEIYLVDYDGAMVEMKTDLRSITLSPRWAPKGDRLAFTTFVHGAPELAGLRFEDGKIWTISDRPGMNSAPCWSPKGDRLAASLSFEGNSEIYLLDESGRDPRRLTYDAGIDTSPSFDPRGDRIAFTSDRSGEPQIYVMDSDGTNQRRLTFVGKHSDSADWSPKGDRIVFVTLIDRVFDICTISPDGSDLRRLTEGIGNCENPRWSPDGRQLVFARRTGSERRLFVMGADGANLRQLTWLRGDQYNPAWSPPLGR